MSAGLWTKGAQEALSTCACGIPPDRVIIYSLDSGRLVRSDAVSGTDYTVARFVDDVEFTVAGGDLEISIDFSFGDFDETYSFTTADLP